MTQRIPQSTAFLCVFKAFLSSDHVTEATGKTIAITISKNGGAFGNLNAGATNATEISSGWYKVSLDTTDTGTLGPLAVRGAVGTVDDIGILLEVVSATSGGYTNLDAAITTRASQASLDVVDDYVDTEVAAIKAKTDNLPAAPAAVSDIPTANQNADTLLDRAAGVETGWTVRQAFRVFLAALDGLCSGLATTTATYQNPAGTKNRIVATVDADGNRTAIVNDVT